MKKRLLQKLQMLCLLLPLTGFSQWVQLGQTFESLNYNYEAPAIPIEYGTPLSYLGDEYGDAVALSADGSIMAVGAPSQYNSAYGFGMPGFGYVRVFRYTDEGWVQIGEELRTGDRDNIWPHNISHFGFKVALSDDGNILAVGEPYWQSIEEDLYVRGGRVNIYKNINDQWVQIGNPITEYDEDTFGQAMSLSADGNIVAVGNPKFFDGENGGKVKTYKNVSGEWVQFGSELSVPYDGLNMFEEPLFGYEITMSADGKTLVVGMGTGGIVQTSSAEARIYDYIADDWVLTGTVYGASGTQFTYSMSLSADGSRLAVSAPIALGLKGRVTVYDKSNGAWEQTAVINGVAPFGTFGTSISLSKNGNVLAVGSFPFMNLPTNPQVKVYNWNGTEWIQNGSFNYEPTWTDGSGQTGGVDTVVALSADGSVLAVGDRSYSIPDENATYNGVYNGAGRAYAYLDCSFVTISVIAEVVEPICEGQKITLRASIEQEIYATNGKINWYSNVDDTTPFHVGTSYETPELTTTTSYWVEAVTATGCPSERIEVVVTINDKTTPSIAFSYSEACTTEIAALPVLAENFTQGGMFYAQTGLSVNPETGAVDASLSAPGTYRVTYEIPENIDLCQASGSFEAEIIIKICDIQKGISANGDGYNDNFELSNLSVKRLEIFNRYGMKVYSKGNYTNEWYGQSDKGDELPDGTYYYVIHRNNGENITGWIYITREQ